MKISNNRDNKSIPKDSAEYISLKLARILLDDEKFGEYEKSVIENILCEIEPSLFKGNKLEHPFEVLIKELADRIEPDLRKNLRLDANSNDKR